MPGVACTDFFQPIVSEINRQARKEAYTLLFAEVFSLDRAERIRQVRELAAEFVRKNVAGIIYEPLAGPGGVELVRGGHFKKEWVLRAEADDVAALKRHIRRFGRPDAFVCSNDAIAAAFLSSWRRNRLPSAARRCT